MGQLATPSCCHTNGAKLTPTAAYQEPCIGMSSILLRLLDVLYQVRYLGAVVLTKLVHVLAILDGFEGVSATSRMCHGAEVCEVRFMRRLEKGHMTHSEIISAISRVLSMGERHVGHWWLWLYQFMMHVQPNE